MPAPVVPVYAVYGEDERSAQIGVLHVETVRQRNPIHFGAVAPHVHPRLGQVTVWTSGSGVYRIDDRRWNFVAPAAAFVPSGVVHGFDISADADAIVVSVADVLLAAMAERIGPSLTGAVFVMGVADDPAWRRLAALARLVLAEYREGDADAVGARSALEALATAILAAVLRLSGGDPVAATSATRLAQRLRDAVNAHHREDWSVGHYVAHLSTTPHLLDRAARDVLGSTVKELVLERRLLEAKRLLLFTIRSVEDIGFELGYADPAYFSRFFRRRTGETPTGWRQRASATSTSMLS